MQRHGASKMSLSVYLLPTMKVLLLAGVLAAGLALTGCDTYDTVEYRDGSGHYGHTRTDVVVRDGYYDRGGGYYNRGYRGRDYRRVNVYDRDYDRRREVNRVVVRDTNRTNVNRVVVRDNDRNRSTVNRVNVRNNDRVSNVRRVDVRNDNRNRDVRRVSARDNDRSREVRRTNVSSRTRGDGDGRRGNDNDNDRRVRTVL